MADTPKSPPTTSSPSAPGRDTTTPTDTGSSDTSSLEARIRDLEATVVAQRAAMPLSLIPLHGAGEGEEVAATWSQAEQEAAKAES